MVDQPVIRSWYGLFITANLSYQLYMVDHLKVCWTYLEIHKKNSLPQNQLTYMQHAVVDMNFSMLENTLYMHR